MTGMLFSWVKTDPLDEKFSKNLNWTDIFIVGNSKGYVE